MSYYKYKPRDPQVQVNWTEAASNLTKVVEDEKNLRIEKKTAIDDATREYQKQLNNQPQGESTSIREWGLQFGDEAQKAMMMQEQLLKSGMLNPSQYTQMRQNLVDGTDQAFSLMENYQEVYANKMERMKSQDIATSSQALEVWMMENAEGFANFNNSQLAINPETGKVTAAMMRTNSVSGERELTQDPNQFVAVSSLQGQILTEYDKFDAGAVSSKFVEETGAWTTVEKLTGSRLEAGRLLTSIDPTSKTLTDVDKAALTKAYPGEDMAGIIDIYLSAENAAIDGIFGNPYNLTSILTENVVMTDGGKNYTFTFDEVEANANPEMILMERQGERNVPVFDKSRNKHAVEQEKAIRAWMRVDIRNKINKEEKAVSVKDYNPPTYKPADPKDVRDDARDLEKKQNAQKTWNSIKGQTADERVASFANILGTQIAQNAGLVGINPSEDGMSIEFVYNAANSEGNRTIDISEGISDEEWAIIGNEITGLDNPEDAMAAGGFVTGTDGNSKAYNPKYISGANRKGNEQRFNNELSTYIGKGFPRDDDDNSFLKKEQKVVAERMNKLYSKYGLTATAVGIAGDDNTLITIDGWGGDGVTDKTFEMDSDFNTNANAIEVEEAFEEWFTAVMKKTNKIAQIAKTEGFTGRNKKANSTEDDAGFGPCEDGKKIELATGLPIDC
tara:strand:+ start:579 stop:2603 length:2025 start_codon:yes stop_codon:yes gene_type:complete